MNYIRISEVLNAGVLIEASNTKILIDGIHYTKSFEWSSIDENLMHQIIYTNKDFQNINFLLFSHQHCDHFDRDKTLEYTKYNDVEKLAICDFRNEELEKNGILEELKTNFFEVGTFDTADIRINYFKTKHLKDEQYGINHYSFIINTNNKNILYLGDADFGKKETLEPLMNYKIDVIIAPFIIATSVIGINFINETNPDFLILNHLPNKEDDKYNYRSITEKSVKKYLTNKTITIILQEFNDSIKISTDNAA